METHARLVCAGDSRGFGASSLAEPLIRSGSSISEDPLPVTLRYRNDLDTLDGGHWRGPDGHVVHLLTWVTDDLHRLEETVPRGPDPDLDAARKVAARLGSDAEVVREDEARGGPTP